MNRDGEGEGVSAIDGDGDAVMTGSGDERVDVSGTVVTLSLLATLDDGGTGEAVADEGILSQRPNHC